MLELNINFTPYREIEPFRKKKPKTDEEIVRRALLKAWTQLLNRYATPGTPIPPVEFVREELIQVGVEAGVKALCKEHWYYPDWAVRPQVEKEIEHQLSGFDLERFLRDVEAAQSDSHLLLELKKRIEQYLIPEKADPWEFSAN